MANTTKRTFLLPKVLLCVAGCWYKTEDAGNLLAGLQINYRLLRSAQPDMINTYILKLGIQMQSSNDTKVLEFH